MKYHYLPSGEIGTTGYIGNVILGKKILEAVMEFGNSHAWEYEEA
jgi:hypothetical protein